MTDKIVVEGLYKIFGPSPDAAFQLLEQGLDKDAIFEQTGNTVGVQDANFAVQEGEIFVVMGLSGSGKSTIVRMLNRLIEPTRGAVRIGDRDVTAMNRKALIDMRRHDMSMVFQSFALMPHRTVLENAAFGLEIAKADKKRREERAMAALDQVGLKVNANSYPDELSGGMQQRVGLARALAGDPDILLMDEAFSALDPLIRTEMQDELVALQKQHQRTVVFISHDLDEAMRLGDRIAIMQAGRVVQVGTPEEIVSNPANEYVRSFFHGVNVSQVYHAGDIAGQAQITEIRSADTGVRAALEALRADNRDFAVLLGDDRHYQGAVSVETLDDALRHGDHPGHDQALLTDMTTISAETPLQDVLGQVASSRWPLPVLDEDSRYLGSLSRATILHTLDRTAG